MKKWICIIAAFFYCIQANAQWIIGLHVYPATPTTIDNVQIVVEGMFSSSACSDWYVLSQSQNGSEYSYSVVNCVGLLTVICSNNDTLTLGNNLPAGTYSVIVNLNAGSGDKPCPPFSQWWSSDTIYFDILPFTGLGNENIEKDIKLYPDPVNNTLIIEMPEIPGETFLSLFNLQGKLISNQLMQEGNGEINTSELVPGLYILKGTNSSGIFIKKFIKD